MGGLRNGDALAKGSDSFDAFLRPSRAAKIASVATLVLLAVSALPQNSAKNGGCALVVLSAGTADAVFLRVLHQGLPIRHVLCYTLAHEGYGPLSSSCCLQLQL